MVMISVRNLNFSYVNQMGNVTPVLKNVNFDVQSGEMVAIQGPSGSGKSTLLYILGGLLDSYEGQIKVAGHHLKKLTDEQLAYLRNRHIGFIFQQFHLLPKATVTENVLLPRFYPTEYAQNKELSEQKKYGQSWILQLGLEGKENSFPFQLSGGQQQRVAIARVLQQNTQIILADEPTGNLDRKNSRQILDFLHQAHSNGHTVVIITHDDEIAHKCQRIIHLKEGCIDIDVENSNQSKTSLFVPPVEIPQTSFLNLTQKVQIIISVIQLAVKSLRQNRARSSLNMLGIVIGVAAVLSMMTLGQFTKNQILKSYNELGVNTLLFYGYENWDRKATDQVTKIFQGFDWEKEISVLPQLFPEIVHMSPLLNSWETKISYGGKTVDSDTRLLGVGMDGMKLLGRKISLGKNFTPFHIDNRDSVCLLGSELAQQLFTLESPLGKMIFIKQQSGSFSCRVLGVLAPKQTKDDWDHPNLNVFLPYTFFQSVSELWYSKIKRVLIQISPGHNTVLLGTKLKSLFGLRYGKSAEFSISSDTELIAQMTRFLNLFTLLLTAIAFLVLSVGGMGITNMMLVSVSERLKEIGIRKAFGATRKSIRMQYMVESLFICGLAGFLGLVVGFIFYESIIYGVSRFTAKVQFEWVMDGWSLILSMGSIGLVGLASGITPALKAERLQVIEALRND